MANGGINAVGRFGFALNNLGDEVRLTCGNTVIDQVSYSVATGFPIEAGVSLAVNPQMMNADSNDVVGHWCQGVDAIPNAGSDRGSPGSANPECDACNPNPCDAPPASTCNGLDVVSYALPSSCSIANGVQLHLHDPELRVPEGTICGDGVCVPDLRGCRAGGCAAGRVCNQTLPNARMLLGRLCQTNGYPVGPQ